jgi:CBS domain-containing protein
MIILLCAFFCLLVGYMTKLDFKVEDVMNTVVITIEAAQTIKQAAKIMKHWAVSSLVVMKKKNLQGIITENDLVSRVMAEGQDPEETSIESVMSQPVIVVKSNQNLESAVKVFLSHRIKKLPVLGGELGKELVGILSLTDVAMICPDLFSTIRLLAEKQPVSVQKNVDFYIC